jgi:hypothetical protein
VCTFDRGGDSPEGRVALKRGGDSPEGRVALDRCGDSPKGRLALERGGDSWCGAWPSSEAETRSRVVEAGCLMGR